jgi:hypothetical protein
MKIKLLLLLFLFITISIPNFAQRTPQEEALQLFEDGNYKEALPCFKRLITLFPKDARYQYYAGVCMVQNNAELQKAIDYLTFSSTKTVPRNVYFFLGKAYHYTYRFNEALEAYLKFQQFGERADKELLQCDMHINMAREGKKLLEKKYELDLRKTDTINREDLYSFYNRQLKSGKFVEKEGRSSFLSQTKDMTWCFVPSLLSNSQPVFESLPGGNHKSKDLFQVQKLPEDEWSHPANLGSIINSPYDEDYAFFNVGTSTLYFASKGHNSMGGYDLFKSVFNPDTKSWSTPQNMGFPFNTPYDDFMFVPSDDQTRAIFVSNRGTSGNKLVVYTIPFSNNYSTVDLNSNINYVSQANLSKASKPVAKTMESKPETKPVKQIKPPVSHAYPVELLNQTEYNNLLNSALQYQLQSDSISRVAEDLRLIAQNSKNATEKDKLKKEVYSLQQRSKSTQHKADELYEKARNYEEMYSNKKEQKESSPKVTQDMMRNALITDTSKPPEPKKIEEKRVNNSKPSKTTVIYEFKVMAKSPYASTEQIPMNQKLPDGLIYRIQMGAFSKPVEPDRFKGIVPINAESVKNGTITKYYAGLFNRMADAEKALNKVREYGFKDAYIISFYNGKNIPINRAKELEKDKP